jgi:hypothetical protein
LTYALDGGEWSALRPGRFASRKSAPDSHWIGGSVGPRAGLDALVEYELFLCQASKKLHFAWEPQATFLFMSLRVEAN